MPRATASNIPMPYVVGYLIHALIVRGRLKEEVISHITSTLKTTLSTGIVSFMHRNKNNDDRTDFIIESLLERMAFLTGDDHGTDGLPNTFSNAEWGSFWLGYYHARAGKPLSEAPDDESASARMEMRLPPRLKEWALSQGGTAYIVALMEADKAKRDTV